MPQSVISGYDINFLFGEAQVRWLKPAEVLHILKNYEKYQLNEEPPKQPTGGSLFLFNKRVLRFFRRDGLSWRKKKDGKTVGEAHERLKVGNVEALNCYYAHGEENPNFQRRSYWMLDPVYEHIVLVHYRDICDGKTTSGSVANLSPGSSSVFSPSPTSCTSLNRDSTSVISDLHGPYQNSPSPSSIEVSSEIVRKGNRLETTAEFTGSAKAEVSQYLRRLEEQLSLDDDSIKDIIEFRDKEGVKHDPELLDYGKISENEQSLNSLHRPEYSGNSQGYIGHAGTQQWNNNPVHPWDAGKRGLYPQSYPQENLERTGRATQSWNEASVSSKTSHSVNNQEPAGQNAYNWPNFNGTGIGNSSLFLPQEVERIEVPAYSAITRTPEINPDYYRTPFGQGQFGETNSSFEQQHKFIIREISPEWGFAAEATKVIIVGYFLCDPSESKWTCMFGDTEVPVEIVQDGVLRCEAPPCLPGKVTLCITSASSQPLSEIREFEYRPKSNGSTQTETSKSPDELLLLVRFVQMLLSDSSLDKGDSIGSGIHMLTKIKPDDDTWGNIMEALLFGNGTSSDTIDWLLQQLLKDKLQQWLSLKSQEIQVEGSCFLSKKEQGIIHMVAGLGFEWALSPILSYGVSVDFRDINGWTALHWAARFGREEMVASLLACGASAGAVTDPTPQDPVGRSPAFIAASSGHKGLAGYLSEKALTSHLSSLTLEESELSKGSAVFEAERTVNEISRGKFDATVDQVSLKDTLAAVRNSAQAAARIQSAFRAHSFRKRQQKESAGSSNSIDEYGIYAGDIQGLSAMSKLAFRNVPDHNIAALSIQKKYRGWKGRKDFLAFRQKVVKIQAHVRGYQVRKHYKVICWAVGVLDKVILRWRRKGAGLRGFRNEAEPIEESEDEDILKVFRKQKVDGAIDEAVSRVLSMVDSPDARQQYHRMLQRYRQAKAEHDETKQAIASTSLQDFSDIEIDNMFDFR